MKTYRVAPLILMFLAGCGYRQFSPPDQIKQTEIAMPTAENAAPMTAAKIKKIATRHLTNPVHVHEKVISGGLPEGDEAFAELKDLGIKTVISVDGSKPDVVRAQKYGMRYVHLPHGYDGVPEKRAKELAKAVRELPGPIYVHCHHGKHRSPAAAAVACVGAGLIGHDEANQVLKVAGTSESYRGLFQSVNLARPMDTTLLDGLLVEFFATAKLPAMAEAMVAIEHVHDHLKTIEKVGWKTPADQPALTPDHEALLLREHFAELLRTDEMKARPKAFQKLTKQAEILSQSLEETLKSSAIDVETASKNFAAVSANCKNCHQAFRDVPLGEKSPNE